MKFQITRGLIVKPQKVVVYGPEGIGKTTFAADFPDPLFIDTEGSTNVYDVARLPAPTSWTMLLDEVREVIKNPTCCKTLVIDTIDWAEQLCVGHVCAKNGKNGIEDFGYGSGYIFVREEFGRFLNLLSDVIEVGINVVLTAHMQMRKFELPNEGGSFDRYELKLGKKTSSQTAPLVKEWADMLLFANYKTIVIAQDKDGKKCKAAGGERVMYTTHHPNWDAKNRQDLPEELPFDFKSIRGCLVYSNTEALQPVLQPVVMQPETLAAPVASVTAIIDTPSGLISVDPALIPVTASGDTVAVQTSKVIPSCVPKALADLMAPEGVTLAEIQKVVAQRGYYPEGTPFENYAEDFVQGCLIGAWPNVFALIKENREIPF